MKPAFELIVHAEQHLRDGSDFDRRVALISFDNAIEVAITTYLGLHPIQRGGREYRRDDVARWLGNYHTKLEFLEGEVQTRGLTLQIPCDEIIYYHKIRGDQYHTGGSGIPEAECLSALRLAALETFGFLFDVSQVDDLLEESLERTASVGPPVTEPNKTADWLLDNGSEPIHLLGQPYPPSEVLRSVDPGAYRGIVAAISESRDISGELRRKYPEYLRAEIRSVSLVHYEDSIYLKTETTDGELDLVDTDFIAGGVGEDRFFLSERDPNENADLLIDGLDPYSLINCFGFFSDVAAREIAETYRVEQSYHPEGTTEN
jgi:hypothetical protein